MNPAHKPGSAERAGGRLRASERSVLRDEDFEALPERSVDTLSGYGADASSPLPRDERDALAVKAGRRAFISAISLWKCKYCTPGSARYALPCRMAHASGDARIFP